MRFPYLSVLDFPNHQKRIRYLPWIRFGISNPKNKSEIIYPIEYEDLIAFSKEKFPVTMPQQTAILGTIGFFRYLKITFDYPKFIDIESNFSY